MFALETVQKRPLMTQLALTMIWIKRGESTHDGATASARAREKKKKLINQHMKKQRLFRLISKVGREEKARM